MGEPWVPPHSFSHASAQVSAISGVLHNVANDQRRPGALAVIESVRCLECGTLYAKPAGGGTAKENPGCPECGYVGWLSASIPFRAASERRRFGEDPRQHHSARSG